MKFFFADSFDMVDPTFDFETETRADWRIRQRDDLYAHEIFQNPPYDGVLVSKAMVDGNSGTGSRYSVAQRQRFWRNGVRAFFRSKASPGVSTVSDSVAALQTMGDCGAFSYVNEEFPPLTTNEAIEFYERCGFDYGISVDHVILGFESGAGAKFPGFVDVPTEWSRRQEITLELANEFFQRCQSRLVSFIPLGVAQGWSPASYAFAVDQLQKVGYQRIALGGMVPLKTTAILQCLEAIGVVRNPDTFLHLLGVTRCEHIAHFQQFGVTSFDSTSPLRQAFKDERDNYYTMDRNYPAIRVPQTEGNPQLQSRIRSGELCQGDVRRLEERCLLGLTEYDRGRLSLDVVMEYILEYERVHHPKEERSMIYREVLNDRPWTACPCEVCQSIGIQVILFRGTERNKRRGFHNLGVFFTRIQNELGRPVQA